VTVFFCLCFAEALSDSDVHVIIHRVSAECNINITADDVFCYYEAFAEFDRDNSRNISTSELGHVMRSLGENPTSMELEVSIVFLSHKSRTALMAAIYASPAHLMNVKRASES